MTLVQIKGTSKKIRRVKTKFVFFAHTAFPLFIAVLNRSSALKYSFKSGKIPSIKSATIRPNTKLPCLFRWVLSPSFKLYCLAPDSPIAFTNLRDSSFKFITRNPPFLAASNVSCRCRAKLSVGPDEPENWRRVRGVTRILNFRPEKWTSKKWLCV